MSKSASLAFRKEENGAMKRFGNTKGERLTQAQSNPFAYTDSNKRYYTYDYYLKRTFGGKCAKIPLDAGFTCPNIDVRCGWGGCIYCSGRGSGDFAQEATVPLREQYELTRAALSSKWDTSRCIPYFQAHTNTYAPLSVLREKYEQALALPGAGSPRFHWRHQSTNPQPSGFQRPSPSHPASR